MRILFSAPDFAWPPVRGGHVRVLSQLRVLASLPEVEQIRVFWLREDPLAWRDCDGIERAIPKTSVARPVFHPIHLRRHPRYIPRVAWLRFAHGVPYVAGKWESPTVRRALAAELRATPFDAVWLGALGTSRYLPLIRRLSPGARVILDGHNVESDIWREFVGRQRGVRRALAAAEWRATRRFECDVLRAVDAVGAISDEDARAYRALAGVDALHVPQVVPFVRRPPAASPGPHVSFVGTLSWHPNVLGLEWFCREVWPLVRGGLAGATFEIAGRRTRNPHRTTAMACGWRDASWLRARSVGALLALRRNGRADPRRIRRPHEAPRGVPERRPGDHDAGRRARAFARKRAGGVHRIGARAVCRTRDRGRDVGSITAALV